MYYVMLEYSNFGHYEDFWSGKDLCGIFDCKEKAIDCMKSKLKDDIQKYKDLEEITDIKYYDHGLSYVIGNKKDWMSTYKKYTMEKIKLNDILETFDSFIYSYN